MYMFGYAEIHYRPRFLPSFLARRSPEILFDAPRRIEPETSIPVGLVIKDAHKFPISIENVLIHMLYDDDTERAARFPYSGKRIDIPVWWDDFNIIPERSGWVQITPYLEFVMQGKQRTIVVDGYGGLSHAPLYVYASQHPLPTKSGWYHGDIHCHTEYTEDQIEFGAPLGFIAHAAKSLGLDWIAATDHSYDLDDIPGSWTDKDPLLSKWEHLRQSAVLEEHSVTVLTGEEVSCRGQNGGNRHLLCIGNKDFIHGAGDSGENPLKNSSEHSIGSAVQACALSGGIACAAHPFERSGVMEQLILKRKPWTVKDIRTDGLCALQFHNGIHDRGYRDGKKHWITLLLEGRRMFAFGGNDSHGNMNRRRSIRIPLFSIVEDMKHLLGAVRTVVLAESNAEIHIMEGLRNGHAIITDGPFLDLKTICNNIEYGVGDDSPPGNHRISAVCYSSEEFGQIASVSIMTGHTGATAENVFVSETTDRYEIDCRIDKESYIRAECITERGHIAITNPIWISQG